MAFIVKKKIGEKEYFYLNENKRVEGKVKTKTLAYLGKNKKDAEEKMKKILKSKIEIKSENKLGEKKMEEQDSTKISIEDMAAFCKRKGFVFKSSEIYGGFSGFWDFGPFGSELFNNLKQDFWKFFVHQKENMVGIEASIISHPRTWKASGHLAVFGDMMIYCKKNKKQFRADHLIEQVLKIRADGMKKEEMLELFKKNKDKFRKEGYDLDEEITKFNLMFKTNVGATEGNDAYLRGETAQAMFMDFKLIQETSRKQLPFGVAQIGRCFRNEIAPRDFLFRSREFTIGEFEFFIHPEEKKCNLLEKKHLHLELRLLDAETQEKRKEDLKKTTIGEMIKEGRLDEWHAYWLAEQLLWFEKLGLKNKIKVREHMKGELSHYSSATFDLDFEYPFGSKEVGGNANRGQYDLTQHMNESKEKLEMFDEATKKKIIPRVIEPTFGMERIFLALLCESYNYDEKRQNVVLKLPAYLAPVKASVFPIVKKDEFEKIARKVFSDLSSEWKINYDESGSIGRRYARNDEIGTPYCITIDDESLKNENVTIRDRNTTKQIRVKISHLKDTLRKLLNEEIIFEKAGEVVK